MSLWGRIFAAMYDRFTAKSERDTFAAHRKALLAGAAGDVLEIGGGTGANLQYYGGEVATLTITEPEKPMVKRLQERIDSARPEAKLLRAPAEDLPFDDASFDVAVSTLVLCTVDDQPRALRELRRVLRPGGRLLFMEHVRSDDPKVARSQDRMLPINVRLLHGCHCNRPTLDGIRAAGFEVAEVEHDTIAHAPKFAGPLIVGIAVNAPEPEAASGAEADPVHVTGG
jgi:ubiquinone/menaquinone biosynthesis C-methylase UbiE